MSADFVREKELHEKRGDIATEMRAMVRKADEAGGSMTASQQRRFDELSKQEESLRCELATQQAENEAVAQKAIDIVNGKRDSVTMSRESVELRALKPTESYREWFSREYPHEAQDYRGITWGGFCRAMICGPKTEQEKRALAEGTDSAGGYTVPTILVAELIDNLRAQSVLLQAGARTLPLGTDETKFAKLTTDPTVSWRAEAASISDNSPTFSAITFTPKSAVSLVKASRELVEDSVNLDEALSRGFAGSFASDLDRVSLVGYSTLNEPLGILNSTGVSSTVMGSSDAGANLTNYSPILTAAQGLLDNNAMFPTACIMAPRDYITLGKLQDTTNQPMAKPPMLDPVKLLATTNVSTTETVVSGSTTVADGSRLYVGYYPDLVFGMRNNLRVEVLRERYAENYQYGFLAALRADTALWHDESFYMVTQISPTASS